MPPLTPGEQTLMRTRKECGINALRILQEVTPVRSTNYIFDFTSSTEDRTLVQLRRGIDRRAMSRSLTVTMASRLGNCDEKAKLCLAGLIGNPRITVPNGHHCTLCRGLNYDHVFIVVTDLPIPANTQLANLGRTAMVLDGWTEDWYFPNLPAENNGWFDEFTHLPNLRQAWVRSNTRAANIGPYPMVNFNVGV